MDPNLTEVYGSADCLCSAVEVDAALDRLAVAIQARLADRDPLLLCVLTGGIVPFGHLLTRLNFPLRIDYLHATRYENQTQGGHLRWIVHPTTDLIGKTVLVVDDILDEGVTLAAILDYCRAAGVKEVLSAVLVCKDRMRSVQIVPDFIGLTVPDRYVFGYGLDYHGYWRNAPGIYAVKGL